MAHIIKRSLLKQTIAPADYQQEIAIEAHFHFKKEALPESDSTTPASEPDQVKPFDPTTHPEWIKRIQTAEEEAYQVGLQKGLDEAKRNQDTIRSRFTALMERIPRELDRQAERIEECAIPVAFSAVVRIVGEHALDRPRAISSIKATLAEIRAESITCLQLSPIDYEFLEAHKIDLGDRRVMQIVPSTRVEIGGCIIDTANGSLDARFETQLQRVHDILKRTLENTPS